MPVAVMQRAVKIAKADHLVDENLFDTLHLYQPVLVSRENVLQGPCLCKMLAKV
jgi:hypothetical protein